MESPNAIGIIDEGDNLDADPLFVVPDDPLGPDGVFMTRHDGLRLRAGSPCIAAADPQRMAKDKQDVDGDGDHDELMPIDLSGRPRFRDGLLDLGAYQWHPARIVTVTVSRDPSNDLVLDVDPEPVSVEQIAAGSWSIELPEAVSTLVRIVRLVVGVQ